MTGILPTLDDVARVAAVSRSTVSRVVNDAPTVSMEMRERVRRVITELGYQPNRAARALASGRADRLHLLVIDDCSEAFSSNPYYTRVLAGILSVLDDSDIRLRIHVVDEPEAGPVLAELVDRTGLGAILVNVRPEVAEALRARYDRVVSLGRSRPGVASIDPNNAAGAYAVVRHLYATGRRRIGYIDGPEYSPCARGRRSGYETAMREAGLPPLYVDGDFRREAGATGVARLLDRRPDLDAVFAACDLSATGALQALTAAGRRVPEDVAVVGFDDCVLAQCANPPLSSVYQPVEQIAALAARDLVHGRVERRWHRVLPTELRVRASSWS